MLWLVFAFNLGFPAYGGPLINSSMGDPVELQPRDAGSHHVVLHHHVRPAGARGGDGGESLRRSSHAGRRQPDERHRRDPHGHGGELRRRRLPRLRTAWSVAVCAPARPSPARPRCRAGSCGAARWRCPSCIRPARSAASSPPSSSCRGRWRAAELARGLVGDRHAVRAGGRTRAVVRARAARGHGAQAATATSAGHRGRARAAKPRPTYITATPWEFRDVIRPAYLLAHRVLAGGRQRRLHVVPRARHRAPAGSRAFGRGRRAARSRP